jgi:hypothetical protein
VIFSSTGTDERYEVRVIDLTQRKRRVEGAHARHRVRS